jgi:hypothetical protein
MRRALFGGLMLALAVVVGCGGGVAPVPVPPVPPTPPAPKIPAGFVLVEDPTAATAARGQFFASPKVSAFLRNSGLKDSIVSINATGPDGKPLGGRTGELIAAAKTKSLPYLFVYADDGSVIKELPAPLDPDAFVAAFVAPVTPAFGNIPSPPLMSLPEFGSDNVTRVIPRAEWKTVSLQAYLPPVYNQGSVGQCNASAACTALETNREMRGLPAVKLSAGDLYSRINGGRDNGSTLDAGMEAILRDGVVSTDTAPYVWDRRPPRRGDSVAAERRQFRAVEVYRCPTFDHQASAIQQGFTLVCGVWWWDNFTPDRDGWLPSQGRGNRGGHALCNYSLERRERNGRTQWGLGTRNSWGVGWGNGGDCVIGEEHLSNDWGMYAIRSVVHEVDQLRPSPRLSSPARQMRLSLSDGLIAVE